MCVRLGWPQVRVEVRSGVPVVTADTFVAAVHTADGTLPRSQRRARHRYSGTSATRRGSCLAPRSCAGRERFWSIVGIEHVDSDGQVHFDAVSADNPAAIELIARASAS